MRDKDYIVPWSGRGRGYEEAEIKTVIEAMRNADPLTQGRYQIRFEDKFARFMGRRQAFAVSSCTAALELSAALSGVGPGDEVIIPAHTFAATAIPFAKTGARIVWADIDGNTRLATAETIRKCLSGKTRIIVIVHLYGLSAEMGPIIELAKKNKLLVVEDAAQAPGARYKGRRIGTFGDFGCFSFHSHKNISTLGEGGMLLVRDSCLAKKVPGLRHNGIREYGEKKKEYWLPAMSNVDFDIDCKWPFNFCIGEIQCALGEKLLDRLDRINRLRRVRALKIIRALRGFRELKFQSVPPGCEHVYHLLSARFDGGKSGKSRDDFMSVMAFEHKVKMLIQYYPLYRYPMFIKAGFGKADCPNTEEYFNSMVSFPFHQWLREEQIDYMINAIKKTLRGLREHR